LFGQLLRYEHSITNLERKLASKDFVKSKKFWSKFMKKSLFVGCLLLLMTGCGTEKPASKAVSADTQSQTSQLSKESTKTSSAAQNKIELVNAGTEPKQQLRFAPPANTKQTVQMTMKMDMAMSVGGQTQPTMASPPIQMTMEAQVTKVDANGDIHANFSYTDADVVAAANTPPELVNAMRSQLKKLVGFKGSIVVDSQGNTKQANIDVPEGIDPNTRQMTDQMVNSLKQISSPVPVEPVGVGAKWRVPNSITANGMTMNQVATYELVDLKDNVATMQVNIEQQADAQKMNPPGLPAGASVDLKSLKSQGNGKITMALNQIMPTSSNISVRSNMEMEVKDPNNQKPTTMGMNSQMQITLESK
jgi:hypothetical protein